MKLFFYILITIFFGASCNTPSPPNKNNVKEDFKINHPNCELVKIEHLEFEGWFTIFNVEYIEYDDTLSEIWDYHTSGPLSFENYTLSIKKNKSNK